MLIVLTFFVALLCGALGGLLYHMQQPLPERESNTVRDISWPRHGDDKLARKAGTSPFHLGVVGDCLYGAVGGILLLAITNRVVGNFVNPIFAPEGITATGADSTFAAWLYLTATAMVGGYLGLRLLRLATGSSLAQWKRQLELQNHNLCILEEELRETRSSALMFEGIEKLRLGYFPQALRLFESALALTPTRSRVHGLLGFCKSFLAEERFRVAGQEHISFEHALKDLNEAVRLIEEEKDRTVDASVIAPVYYNRACVQYLKWRSQGRSPSKLTDEEVGKLKSDIHKALAEDPSRLIWRTFLADCGLAKGEFGGDDLFTTRDFKDLYESSQPFKNFLVELKDARTPVTPVQQLHKAAVGLEHDGY